MGKLAKRQPENNAAQAWADRVVAATRLGAAVGAIIAGGRELIAAKNDPDLRHGEWERMFSDRLEHVERPIPFGHRTGHMMMAVARHAILTEGNHGSLLPPSWRTLYELTKVENSVLLAAMADGRIHPDMERRHVWALMAPKAPPETPPPPEGTYRAIVIDPPWPVEKISLERRSQEKLAMDYVTWPLERIRDELPIAKLAAPDGAHIYLWVTHRFLPFGLECFKEWGVRYECLLTWWKPTAQPLWWTFNTEHALFGKIATLAPLEKGVPVGFTAPQQRHSHKPEEFFDLVRRVSPDPRLTMFDETREGFTVWGVSHR